MKYQNTKVMEVDEDVFLPLSTQPTALIERLEAKQCILCNKPLANDVAIMYVEFPEKPLTLWWHTYTSGHDYRIPGCHEEPKNDLKSYSESYQQHAVDSLNK